MADSRKNIRGKILKKKDKNLSKKSRAEEIRRFTKDFIERYRPALEALAKK